MSGCFGTHPEDVARERELHAYLDAQHGDDDVRRDAADALIHDEDARHRWIGDLHSDGELDAVILMALRMYGSSKANRIDVDNCELGKCFAQVVYRAEEAYVDAAAEKAPDLFASMSLPSVKWMGEGE